MNYNHLKAALIVVLSSQISFGQNTFPTNGNVGIGTNTPSERLDVNGNMIVDSSLTIKDSLVVDKDLRTKGKLKIEDKAFFLEKVYMYDKLILSTNAEVGNNIVILNNANIENNASITNNVNIGNKLNVTGTSNLEGGVKMPNIPALNNLNAAGLEMVFKTQSGALKTLGVADLINVITDNVDKEDYVLCIPEYAADPYWMAGANKLYTLCEDVFVGIGVSNPMHKLHVLGTSYSRQFLAGSEDGDQDALYNGYSLNNTQYLMKLGKNIQTVDQSVKFSIDNNGAVVISNSGNSTSLTLNNGTGKMIDLISNDGSKILEIGDDGTFIYQMNNSEGFLIKDNQGNEAFKIGGNGILYSKEIKVKIPPFPDYVFEENYELKPLKDVKKFVQEKKHLPGIPPAKEFENDGLSLGEMQVKQMEKIENIYLYLFELEERIKELELENEKLRNE